VSCEVSVDSTGVERLHHRGEEVVGDWTLRVSDQDSPDHKGAFLGWDMVFWGSVIDPAKAVLYEVSHADPVLPPHDDPQPLPPSTGKNTKTHPKPTDFLSAEPSSSGTAASQPSQSTSEQIDVAEGEASMEALPTPTKEPSRISIIVDGLTHKLWTYIILVVVASLIGGIFLWRCRMRGLRSSPYIALPAEGTVSMSDARGRRRSTDSDDDADERTGLNSESYNHRGFHSGFLDDEDEHEYPPSAGPEGQDRSRS
jgi:kexin